MSDSRSAINLPPEIWMVIGDQLERPWDLAALSQACRRLHAVINPLLYQHAVKYGYDLRIMFWAIQYRLPETLRRTLAAGADPNVVWLYFDPRPGTVYKAPSFDECFGTMPSGVIADFALIYPPPYCSPLHLATLLGDLGAMGTLLDHGADPVAGSSRVCRCYDIQHHADPQEESAFVYQSLCDPRWTPSHISICAGNIDALKLLSSRGGGVEMQSIDPDPNTVYSRLTPVHVASMSGQAEMLEWLLNYDKQYDVDALDASGRTALSFAYYARHWDCVALLIRSGADLNRYNTVNLMGHRLGLGYEPIHRPSDGILAQGTLLADSITPSKFEDALRLLDLGADPVIADRTLQILQGEMPLIHKLCCLPWDSISRPAHDAGVELLSHFIKLGLNFSRSVFHGRQDVNDLPRPGHTALGHAARFGNLSAAQRLIEAGAAVDGNPQEDRCTPLTHACQFATGKSLLDMVNLLINSGASVNRLRVGSEAPLWNLIKRTDYEGLAFNQLCEGLTDLLLRVGSNPGRGTSSEDISYQTALEHHLAAGNFDQLDYLLLNSAQGLFGDDDVLGLWNVALMYSGLDRIPYVIRIDKNGVIARKDPKALLILLRQDSVDVDLVMCVLEQGADPNINLEGHTPLGYVLQQPFMEASKKITIIQALLKFGASIFQTLMPTESTCLPEEAPSTPLAMAIHMLQPYFQIVEIMLEHQPLRDAPDIDPYAYILQACAIGNPQALTALIISNASPSNMQAQAINILRHVLDLAPQRKTTIREINMVIDCVHILVQNGAYLSILAPAESLDPRTGREKLIHFCENLYFSTTNSLKSRAITWCFQQRLDFSGEDDLSIFKGHTMEPFFQSYISLEQLGRILEDTSRTWTLHFRA